MSEETKRLGIKLNRDTVVAFNEFKQKLYGSSEIPVSESFLLEEAYKKIAPVIKDKQIDWDSLNSDRIPNINNEKYQNVALLHTTLTLNQDIYSSINNIQKEMHQVTGKRIFFSFIVKLVMFAAVLEQDGQLSSYLI